ncbi:MAG: tRNA (N6-isopentenyl adenosine(37)-C2)-methylthiotransferase MiaB [Alphaproteobacteria bacterium]|jgi:tRNA-2-methylthio-N6-dimethylallyladenosine synthase|nr:tRNA (N6-isopentenyl adenosine(37)-C2)-methylthiotransferase MiaB [Thalassospira sp.]MCE2964385.1 tRNA (N6-isopentenyl adenosine(37)-C2)-methylthiotransferase MiaB [Alphaproteobacteria bacterium]
MEKRVFIKTFGCQMNVYDSTKMLSLLRPLGYTETETAADADLMLLNTCHIREKAAEKVYSDLGRLRDLRLKREKIGKATLIGVTGCVAQAEQDEVTRRAPYVDVVLGPQSYHRLPELVAAAEEKHTGKRPNLIAADFTPESKFDQLPMAGSKQGSSAFLTIQEGCDKFCTFCVVPYTRGAEYSRTAAAVLEEARILIAEGAVEITLLGQNVNAYHGLAADGTSWGLAQLLHAVAALPGLQRLRYTTSHPRDVDTALIEAHRDILILQPLLHLPVQSGADKILSAMNRKHTAAEYLDTIAALRRARPDIAFSSDFIVGYPGETDADFEATLELVRLVEFVGAYSFKYSPRPGTPAAELAATSVPEAIKDARLAALQELLQKQQYSFNQRALGTEQEVLFSDTERSDGMLFGKTAYLQSVIVEAPARLRGRIERVHIEHAGTNSLKGRLIINEEPLAA